MKRVLISLLLLTGGSATAQTQEFGRLFYTPEERAALDAQRRARVPDRPTAAAPSPVTRIDGRMQRKGQPAAVWVNGELVGEGANTGALRVVPGRADPGRAQVTPPGSKRGVGLKVGETLDHGSGEVKDVVEGKIRIHRTPAGAR